MQDRSPEWFDAQYNNRARIPEHPQILSDWSESSERARAALPAALDLPYGDDPAERLDLFGRPGGGAPILFYIHGGYWRALDKRDHSFIATPFVEAGALVVLPNYGLCPTVTIGEILAQMQRAVAWIHRHAQAHGGDPARLVVAGHSAGGHLAAMLLATAAAPGSVPAALSLSGVFDLEPLRHAPFVAPDLRLDADSAHRLSPALLPAPETGRLVALVGADESEEFVRQNRLIESAWGPRVVVACETVPGRHHMNVLYALADPAARTHLWALHLLGLGPKPDRA